MKILSLSLPSIKYITLVILVAGFLLGTFSTPLHKAQAQSTDTASLQAQIQMLMKIVLQLTEQLANQNISSNETSSEGGFSLKDFKDGDEIKTISNLKVRLSPSINGQLVRVIPRGSKGQILTSQNGSYSNPTEANGYTWWRVRYESLGITGWSVENWMKKTERSNMPRTAYHDKPVRVDAFNATIRDYDDIFGPYVDLDWNTTGTEKCSLFYNSRYITTRESDDEYELSNTALTEKYGLPDFGGNGEFELRCQSKYTEKDSTVNSFKRVKFDSSNDGYNLEITSPRSSKIYERGDKVTLKWNQKNLDDDIAIITLQGPIDGGQQTQRHIAQNVSLRTGKKTVTIPTYDDLGIVTSGKYELSIWVTNLKDGSEKSLKDVVKIIVGKDSLPSCRLSTDKSSYKYKDKIKLTWASENTNYVSFVPDTSGKDGLSVPSEKNGDLSGYRYINALVIGNPKVTMEAHAADGSKSYCDITIPIDEGDLVMGSMAIGVGAYEGSYPKGVKHSFGYHPQGEIDVYLSDNPNSDGSLTLVLSAYEPVKWNIIGPGISSIGEVLATGYYDQEVSGINVPVTMLSSESGDRVYFSAYKNSGKQFKKLEDFVKGNYGTKFQMYDGSYKQKKVVFDKWKG